MVSSTHMLTHLLWTLRGLSTSLPTSVFHLPLTQPSAMCPIHLHFFLSLPLLSKNFWVFQSYSQASSPEMSAMSLLPWWYYKFSTKHLNLHTLIVVGGGGVLVKLYRHFQWPMNMLNLRILHKQLGWNTSSYFSSFLVALHSSAIWHKCNQKISNLYNEEEWVELSCQWVELSQNCQWVELSHSNQLRNDNSLHTLNHITDKFSFYSTLFTLDICT